MDAKTREIRLKNGIFVCAYCANRMPDKYCPILHQFAAWSGYCDAWTAKKRTASLTKLIDETVK